MNIFKNALEFLAELASMVIMVLLTPIIYGWYWLKKLSRKDKL